MCVNTKRRCNICEPRANDIVGPSSNIQISPTTPLLQKVQTMKNTMQCCTVDRPGQRNRRKRIFQKKNADKWLMVSVSTHVFNHRTQIQHIPASMLCNQNRTKPQHESQTCCKIARTENRAQRTQCQQRQTNLLACPSANLSTKASPPPPGTENTTPEHTGNKHKTSPTPKILKNYPKIPERKSPVAMGSPELLGTARRTAKKCHKL